jgi:hypothetical protein
MNRKITPCLVAALVALLSAAGLAACSERPQRIMHEGDAARTSESWDGQFRDRTLKQGESERMGH